MSIPILLMCASSADLDLNSDRLRLLSVFFLGGDLYIMLLLVLLSFLRAML